MSIEHVYGSVCLQSIVRTTHSNVTKFSVFGVACGGSGSLLCQHCSGFVDDIIICIMVQMNWDPNLYLKSNESFGRDSYTRKRSEITRFRSWNSKLGNEQTDGGDYVTSHTNQWSLRLDDCVTKGRFPLIPGM